MSATGSQPPGWYYGQGDPPGSQRYWDGTQWLGDPQPVGGAQSSGSGISAGGSGVQGELVSGGLRGAARLIDSLLFIALVYTPIALLGVSSYFFFNSRNSPSRFFVGVLVDIALAIFGACVLVAYEVILNTKFGGTVGKRAVGSKIVKVDGSQLKTKDHLNRAAPFAVLWVLTGIPVLGVFAYLGIFGLIIAGVIMVLTDDKEQTVWDKLAGTLVIKK